MGNRIDIGDNNKLNNTNISGNDVVIEEQRKGNKFWKWFLKHLESIVTAIISGAVCAFVTWLITYLCLK